MTKITDPITYQRRRLVVATLGLGGLATFGYLRYDHRPTESIDAARAAGASASPADNKRAQSPKRRITTKHAATHYNNAYEFGWNKTDPARHAAGFHLRPWTITFDGLVEHPGTFDVDQLMGLPFSQLEERIYDFRCVEAWSMVIPYNGRPLAEILKQVQPLSSARYVAFTSVYRPEEMPGQASPFSTLAWPYVEALTIEEAMHPLTFATFGVYGDPELPQNGMPFRITIPWKYGFKSAKFITRISFTAHRPPATWHQETPAEYGWYSNVYPDISHPRWSQASERRILGEGQIERIPTRPYNGYGEAVAHLYPGNSKQYLSLIHI